MQILDLSLPLSKDTPVFPGDSPPIFESVCNIKEHGWNMTRFTLNTHDATHINVPLHAKSWWNSLDTYSLGDFISPTVLFDEYDDIKPWIWVIFYKENITMEIAQHIVRGKPKFIGLSNIFEFDLEVEKFLLHNDIVSFERLENTSMLPKNFIFYGIPLKILWWDGSPVRAFAQF